MTFHEPATTVHLKFVGHAPGENAMGAGWYYMAKGWIRKNRPVGPISESDLLAKIDQGKISPQTLLQSSKTKGKWVPMNSVGPAMKRWRKLHPDDIESDDTKSDDVEPRSQAPT